MPASAVKTKKNEQNRMNFKPKKELNFIQIQTDENLVIFQFLLAKLQRFQDYLFLPFIDNQKPEIFWLSFTKKAFTQADSKFGIM